MLASPLFPIVIVALLLMGNAFFVTAEYVLVTVRRTWLQHKAAQGNTRAEAALRLVDNLNRVVTGVQIAITMTSLGLGWVGELTIARTIEPLLADSGGKLALVHGIAVPLAFFCITTLHVVLGELVPKRLALESAERLCLAVALPMTLFLKLIRAPLVIVDSASSAIARLLGAKGGRVSHIATAEELKLVVASGYGVGAVPPGQQEMIHRVIDLHEVLVREVMVPRPNIVSVPVTLSLDELLRIVTEDQHSRIPVYEDSPENVIGVFYTKDLLKVWDDEKRLINAGLKPRPFSVRNLLRELLIVPETKPVDQLLREFQERRRHMALVVDEFGSTMGLVTVEDILEQIVGEIQDEYDWEMPPELRLGERTLMLDAGVSILDMENRYGLELPRDEGFETLAGFVLQQLGHIPQTGESFEYANRRFTVAAMDDHRVARVKMEKLD